MVSSRAVRRVLGVAAGLVLGAAAPSEGTWSIIIVDTRSGEIAIGSATCLSGFDLELNASIVVPGIGAAAAQSFVDQTGLNRVFIHDQMLRGTPPSEIITRLAGFDSGHQTRQYGIVDLRENGRAATFTGSGAGQYRGGRTGRLVGGGPTGGDLVWAVQGNVLTGAPVIDAAVAAIENAPGDVPEKLMRAMEEAMRMGGDGRCSCSPSNPTGCGSPPDKFFRTAFIGYIIVSRAGDRPGCNGLYRLNASGPAAIIAADVNADGSPDLLTCNQASSSISVLANTIASGWATYGLPMNYPVGASPRDLVSADFDADGRPDVAVACFNIDAVSVLRGQANGTFAGRADVPAGDGPLGVVAADFDGDGDTDLAAANQLGVSVSVLVNDGAGVFTPAAPVGVGTGPSALAAGDLDADGDTDLVVAVGASPSSIVVLRNTTPPGGAPVFSAEAPIEAGRGVNAVVIGDVTGDARPDVLVLAATDAMVNLFPQSDTGFGVFTPFTFTTGGTGISLGDATGDGVLDVVGVARNIGRIVLLEGAGGGQFLSPRFFPFGQTPSRATLADLNLDGTLDFAAALFNNQQALTVRNFGGGVFNDGGGCASGDYWVNINVANVPPTAGDPVPVIRQQLNAFRADRRGETDAVRSVAGFTGPGIRADGVTTAELVITLHDWEGRPVDAAPERTVGVRAVEGAGLGTTVGEVVLGADGVYRAVVTSGVELGTAHFEVVVQDEPIQRPVVLMPPATLPLLSRADWDLSGVVDSADFFAFLDEFLEGAGEFNNDGVLNSQDFFDFLEVYFER